MSRRDTARWSAAGMVRLRQAMRDAEQASLLHMDTVRDQARAAVGGGGGAGDLAAALGLTPGTDPVAHLGSLTRDLARDITALDRTTLWWVTAPMTTVAVGAATSLPEWTPALAVPDRDGLLCWATPAGTVTWIGAPPAAHTPNAWASPTPPRVTLDGLWWSLHGEVLTVRLLSRLTDHRQHLAPTRAPTPLMVVADLICDAAQTWDHRPAGDDSEQLLTIAGATWLLMQQPRVAERSTVGDVAPPRRDRSSGQPPAQLPEVVLIDLRREHHPTTDEPIHGGREWTRRWWVSGHWRQQAVGTGRTQRRPTWIAAHVKGPDGLPLTEPARVNVWRR